MRKLLRLILSCAFCAITQLALCQSTIQNGVFWNDTQGNRIEAHGAGIIQHNGKWYMLGENRSAGTRNSIVNLYSSSNLVSWTFEKGVITKSTQSQLNDGSRFIERPKLLYCASTGKFVIWCHWEGANYAPAEYAVFSSSTINGNYTFHHSARPTNNMSRDCNVFKDDNGKAYFVSSANENYDLELYELTSDYLNIQSHILRIYDGDHREAPVIFKRNGVYYLLTSGATGWDPNQGKYSTATSLAGPWSALTNFGNSTNYDTQPTTFIQVTGSQTTTFIYCGDRWQDPDLASSKYIWMPLTFSGTSMTLNNSPTWTINLSTGVVGGGGGTTTSNYRIQNRGTSLSIDGMGRTTNGSACGQYASGTSNNQKWVIETAGTYVKIKNLATGLYLDGMGRTTSGSVCGQYAGGTSNNQQWTQEAAGTYFKFKNRATGLYLDGNGLTTNGSNLIQNSSSTSNNQQWTVTRLSSAPAEADNTVAAIGESDISIFPNVLARGDEMTVQGLEGASTISFVDVSGKLVKEQKVIETGSIKIAINLKPGIYFVRITDGKTSVVERLIVK